jgi:hypothetical protein
MELHELVAEIKKMFPEATNISAGFCYQENLAEYGKDYHWDARVYAKGECQHCGSEKVIANASVCRTPKEVLSTLSASRK